MALLHIALQEGFVEDTVAIRVDGREVYQETNVRTRFQIGYADSIDLNVEGCTVNIEVAVPSRSLSESFVLMVSAPIYVGVSITPEDTIEYRLSQEPFGYL